MPRFFRIALLVALVATHPAIADETWQVVVEASEDGQSVGCVLKSNPVNGLAVHYVQRFAVVASEMLDEAPHKTSVKVDRAKAYMGQERAVAPNIIYITNDTPDIDAETGKLLYLLKRGNVIKVSAETILAGDIEANIPLTGFSAAYKQYLACRKKHNL